MTQEELDKLSREEALALLDSIKTTVTEALKVFEGSNIKELTSLDLSKFSADEEFITKAIAIDNTIKKIESYL
jgi:hypothetical protein